MIRVILLLNQLNGAGLVLKIILKNHKCSSMK